MEEQAACVCFVLVVDVKAAPQSGSNKTRYISLILTQALKSHFLLRAAQHQEKS